MYETHPNDPCCGKDYKENVDYQLEKWSEKEDEFMENELEKQFYNKKRWKK